MPCHDLPRALHRAGRTAGHHGAHPQRVAPHHPAPGVRSHEPPLHPPLALFPHRFPGPVRRVAGRWPERERRHRRRRRISTRPLGRTHAGRSGRGPACRRAQDRRPALRRRSAPAHGCLPAGRRRTGPGPARTGDLHGARRGMAHRRQGHAQGGGAQGRPLGAAGLRAGIDQLPHAARHARGAAGAGRGPRAGHRPAARGRMGCGCGALHPHGALGRGTPRGPT